MGMEERKGMTCGERIAVHVIFGLGIIILLFARIIYLGDQAKKHGVNCKEPCCVAKMNLVGSVKTNKPSPFIQGLKNGFEKGLDAGKEKGKE